MEKKKTKKKLLKIILFSTGSLILLFILSFIPTLSLKTSDMKSIDGEWITVYYEKEEAAARDVFEWVEVESERVARALGFELPQGVDLYIYDSQKTFQTKKYGLTALLLNLDWYVGDNRGTRAMLTSPVDPGMHSYDSIKYETSVHEIIHAYNYVLNSNMPLWINEGLAGYLSNQNPQEWGFNPLQWHIPTLKQTRVSNPITFSNIGGYPFSYTYIEYLDKIYGWDNVLILAETNNFNEAFGKDEISIYDEWVEFLRAIDD
ncbi:MAG: hypothetical protein FWE74_05090 [Oscillospiraceae bacterium]|nr:hypothetical protein [Oscillospiraceae bacterium]